MPLNPRGQAIALMTMALLVVLWWQQAFLGIGPQLGDGRESDNFPCHQSAHCWRYRALFTTAAAAQPQRSDRAGGRTPHRDCATLGKSRCLGAAP